MQAIVDSDISLDALTYFQDLILEGILLIESIESIENFARKNWFWDLWVVGNYCLNEGRKGYANLQLGI